MNRARVAAARAQLHEALDAYLDALEARDEEAPPRERRASARRPPTRPRLVRPAGENDDLSRAKARRFLQANGFAKVTP